jgi:hypothetical protein
LLLAAVVVAHMTVAVVELVVLGLEALLLWVVLLLL